MKLNKGIILIILIISVSACDQRGVKQRKYEEILTTTPTSGVDESDPHTSMKGSGSMSNSGGELLPVAKPAISWENPQGWVETKGSRMRLATFSTSSNDPQNRIDCSIVSLRGQAGGLEANVIRWMRQINITVPDTNALEDFLKKSEKMTTKSGLPVKMIDFTLLQSSDDATVPSMMAAIITLEDKTIFVKMVGDKGSVLNNKEEFRFLVESIKI